MTTESGAGVRRRLRVSDLAGLTLLLVVVALVALRYGGGLRSGGFGPGDGALRQRVLLWTVVPAALVALGVLVVALGARRSRAAAVLAGVVTSCVLLVPAVGVAGLDASGDENGFSGCGTLREPQPATGACEAALGAQRTTVVVLGAAAAVPAALSLLLAPGGPSTGRRRTAQR